MFAVVKTGGKQYKVKADDVLKVEKLVGDEGDKVQLDDVLLLSDGKKVQVGTPTISGAAVSAEIISQIRDRKVTVFKKKRRHNYRRKNGHRQNLTVIKITDIISSGAKAATKAKATEKAPVKTPTKAASKPKTEAKKETKLEKLFEAPKGEKDDLKKISGVGPALEKKLNDLGIYTFDQVSKFTKKDIARVDEVLNFKGRIEREDWVKQAKEFSKEKKK